MKLEIIIATLLMLGAIFSKQINKLNILIFGGKRFNWSIENKKIASIIDIIGRVIIFLLGLGGLIYAIFF
ncbi:MAG: hypothetical protein PHS24_05140 [Bacilli bacterium]|nr:hypothetical protein [Bacilli bacterium]